MRDDQETYDPEEYPRVIYVRDEPGLFSRAVITGFGLGCGLFLSSVFIFGAALLVLAILGHAIVIRMPSF